MRLILMKRLSVIITALFLTACADTHQLIRSNVSASKRLTQSDSIFVVIPNDGVYGADAYQGSGQNTAQIIYSAFAKRTHLVTMGSSVQNFNQAQEIARNKRQKFLVYPTILHWEDRATEWSGISDKVEVKIEVVDIVTGSNIASVVVKGDSGLATLGGDHPQDLLSEPIEEFVLSLY